MPRSEKCPQDSSSTLNAAGEDNTERAPSEGGTVERMTGLLRVPMDVFFEIGIHLHPLDLVHLSRTSKCLRSVTLSRKSKYVWAASLGSIRDLPPCPEDMDEPAYAALLFDRVCNLCGSGRANWVHYAIRLRLCKSCDKTNILKGYHILRGVDPWTQMLLLAMTPCETGKDIAIAATLQQPILTHHMDNRYYAPQLRAAVVTLQQRQQADGEPQADYENRLTRDCVKQHQHATSLLLWEHRAALKAQNDKDAMKTTRKNRIVEKLKELGYVEADFPDNQEWTKHVDQPKKLTDRIWLNVKPKLLKLLKDERERKTREAYDSRVKARLHQISSYYDGLVLGMPEIERALMPNQHDAHHLPSINALACQNNARGDVTREAFYAITRQILREADAYKIKAKSIAAMALRECWLHPKTAAWEKDMQDLSPEEVLSRHYALFVCGKEAPPLNTDRPLLTFEDVHDHWRTAHPELEWGFREPCASEAPGYLSLQCAGDHTLGRGILDAARLPQNTTMSVLTALIRSGRLYCSCGDPALPPPEELDWAKWFTHISNDLTWLFQRQMCSASRKPNFILKSHHDDLSMCIRLLPEGADTAPAHVRGVVVDTKVLEDIQDRLARRLPGWFPVCNVCKALTAPNYRHGGRRLALPEIAEEIVHHMRGRHAKEFAMQDFEFAMG